MIIGIILGVLGVLTCVGSIAYAVCDKKANGLFDLDGYRKGERP